MQTATAVQSRVVQSLVQVAAASTGADHIEVVVAEAGPHLLYSTAEATMTATPHPVLKSQPDAVLSISGAAAVANTLGAATMLAVPIACPGGFTGWLALYFTEAHEISATEVATASSIVDAIEADLDRAVEDDFLREAAAKLFESEAIAAAANRDLEQFAYLASHELVAPLRAVAAFTDLLPPLLERNDRDASAHISRCADEIRRGTQQMQEQVNALLELSTISQSTTETTIVELADIVDAAMDTLAEPIATAEATINVAFEPQAAVFGSFVHLQSVFRNIIENAVRYRHPDRPLHIHIGATPATDSMTTISFTDNGIGVDESDRARIFGLFERAAPTVDGSGIGLALSQRIVRRLGGDIGVEPTDEGGSRFWVSLRSV